MRTYAKAWPERVWAVEGANGVGRPLAQRLLEGSGRFTTEVVDGYEKLLLATVRPRDIAGKTRRRIAGEELAELVAVEAKIKKSTAELKAIVLARGSPLMDLHGVGPVVAARVLACHSRRQGGPRSLVALY